jgi:trehalose/maltose hydrolase-like predicted phosphorylase
VEERLRRAGLEGIPEVVELAEEAARQAGLPDPKVTSDAKHVEIGLTDKADSARWVFHHLVELGIGPGQVMVAGDELGPLGGLPGSDSLMLVEEAARSVALSVGVEPNGVPPGVLSLGGGPARFVRLLEDQLRRRRLGDIPFVDADPAWTVTVRGIDPASERMAESLLTLADGRIGTAGSPLAWHASARPEVLVGGAYDGDSASSRLLAGPIWDRLSSRVEPGDELTRTLDMRSGVLAEAMAGTDGPLSSVRFSSLARPGTAVLRALGPAGALAGRALLISPDGLGSQEERAALSAPRGAGRLGKSTRLMTVHSEVSEVSTAAWQSGRRAGPGWGVLDRIASFAADDLGWSTADRARALLERAEAKGFDGLLAEHRTAWASRWADADVVVDGDEELQRAIRFSLFHLMASVPSEGEAAVGARGLTGPAYSGHVFWDSDVFVLPFLAATHAASARAMLEYRIRRLPAAIAIARAFQRAGARFPWESAWTGSDVTPSSARDPSGRLVPIRTGLREEHIVADVVWAATVYADWTGDQNFLANEGLALMVETARYWASRVRFDGYGRAHIYGVIGPDEYHEPVDDNAFTNVMARWNLRQAVKATEGGAGGVGEFERLRWIEIADALVDGYDRKTGRYEQFSGFYKLDPLIVSELGMARPFAADAVLGRERVRAAQVVKQADVLMLHHLLPGEVARGSLLPNLSFYEPRTSHGSSLSPGVHASLFARAGQPHEAVEALRMAANIDLDDLTGSTSGGLHMATMGSVWQALAFGFAGIRPDGEALGIDPRLPANWNALEVRVRFRGNPVRVKMEGESIEVTSPTPLDVRLGSPGRRLRARPPHSTFEKVDGRWRRHPRSHPAG